MLLLGASILTISWEKTGLDRRIAIKFLALIGNSYRGQVVFWFIITTVLSTVLPNAVVCATVIPIAMSMLRLIGEDNIGNSKIGSNILLTIVYAAGLGGLASPLGGAMNLVVVDYIQKLTGTEYMNIDWVIEFIPIVAVLLIIKLVFTVRDIKEGETLGNSKEYFVEATKNMPAMSSQEKMMLILFCVATVLSFTRQLYQDRLPELKPAYIFIICAVLSFLITDEQGKRLMLWKSVQTKVIWEMMNIFGGGLAAGTLINNSGAADCIGDLVVKSGLKGGLLTVYVIVIVTILLSDVTSNTATAAVVIPVVISVMNGIGENPIPYIYIATVGVNLSYMLPTSIRAIPVGYGLQPRYMLSEGWKITLIIVVIMPLVCFCLLEWL